VKNDSYLNWRFRECPHGRYLILVARRDGTLTGFSATELRGELATILDLVFVDSASALSLIQSTISSIRKSPKVKRVDFPTLSESPLAQLAAKTGFHAREGIPVIIKLADSKDFPAEFLTPQNWSLTSGDRDS
jgi:hypothetical protein